MSLTTESGEVEWAEQDASYGLVWFATLILAILTPPDHLCSAGAGSRCFLLQNCFSDVLATQKRPAARGHDDLP